MRALTIRQPWAALIMAGSKDVENRVWPTSFRGRLAIHAGLRFADITSDSITSDSITSDSIPSHSITSDSITSDSITSDSIVPAVGAELGIPADAVMTLPRGVLVGTVELHDCRRDSDSRGALPDRWHWLVRDPEPLAEPVPATGRLGLWTWDERP